MTKRKNYMVRVFRYSINGVYLNIESIYSKLKDMKNLGSIRIYSSFLIIGLFLIGCGGCGGVKKQNKIGNQNEAKNETTNNKLKLESESSKYQELKLTPIDRKEVLDHYIYYTRDTVIGENGKNTIYLFDGKEEKIIKIDPLYEIIVTPNEKYFTLSKLVEKSKNNFEFEVELRDFNNEIQAKGNIPACFNTYYDEFKDAIYPMEDGSGFLQEGARLGGDLLFSVYKIRDNKFYKKFTYDKTTNLDYDKRSINIGIKMNENGSEFIVLRKIERIIRTADKIKIDSSEHFLEFINSNGIINWDIKLGYGNKYSFKSQFDYGIYKDESITSNNIFLLQLKDDGILHRYDNFGRVKYYNKVGTKSHIKFYENKNDPKNIIGFNGYKIFQVTADSLLQFDVDSFENFNQNGQKIYSTLWKSYLVTSVNLDLIYVYNTKNKVGSFFKTKSGCNIPVKINGELYFKQKNIVIDRINIKPSPVIYKPDINFDK